MAGTDVHKQKWVSVSFKDGAERTIHSTDGGRRVWFSYDERIGSFQQEATIRVYDLQDEKAKEVIASCERIHLLCGWTKQDAGVCYVGQVVDSEHIIIENDDYWEYTVIDGDQVSRACVSVSVGAGETPGGMIQQAISAVGGGCHAGYISPKAYSVSLLRGCAFIGGAGDLLRMCAMSSGTIAYVHRGAVECVGPGQSVSGSPVRVGYSTGLEGVPSFTKECVMFSHYVSSALTIGQMITLDDQVGGGTYIIIGVTANGDVLQKVWSMIVVGVHVSVTTDPTVWR